MTFSKDQIQALISEIDGVLQKTTPRLPWVGSGDATQQRRVLERVRNHLVALHKRVVTDETGQASSGPDLLAYDIYYQPSQGQPQVPSPGATSQEMNAQHLLQTIVQEMSYLRSNTLQPLRAELETLRQQREGLIQEIRQLEGQRQNYPTQTPANQQQIIAEFLQALMGRLQDTLSQQVSQTLKNVSSQSLPYRADPALPGAAAMTPSQPLNYPSLESLQAAQANSDQMLVNLDATLRAVFDALQRDVKAYQESLSQGLDRMHTLGQQGEMMFSALINHLAQQLGREASSYLQTPPSLPETETERFSSMEQRSLGAAGQLTSEAAAASNLPFPYPGTELTPSSDFFARLNLAGTPIPSSPGTDETIADRLNPTSTPLSGDHPGSLVPEDLSTANFSLTELDLSGVEAIENTSDIDAALKLLDQLSTEIQGRSLAAPTSSGMAVGQEFSSPPPIESAALEASNAESEPASSATRDELDEFYESLFGTQTAPSEPASQAATVPELPIPPAEADTPATGQISGSMGMEAEAAIDPTLGWDLISSRPLQAAASTSIASANLTLNQPTLPQEPAPSPTVPEGMGDLMPVLPENPSVASASEPLEPGVIDGPGVVLPAGEAAAAIDPGLTSEALSAQGEAGSEVDQITSLTDLFDDAALAEAPAIAPSEVSLPPEQAAAVETQLPQTEIAPAETSVAEPVAEASEETYIPASPNESLLPASEPPTETLGLWIDETTLSSLSEDLSSLEGAGGQRFQEALDLGLDVQDWTVDDFLNDSPQIVNLTASDSELPLVEEDWSDDSLDDFAAALPESDFGEVAELNDASGLPLAAPDDPDDALTLEGMDDLFADVPSIDAESMASDAPAAEPPTAQEESVTLEEIDRLFSEAPAIVTDPVPPPGAPAADEPLGFTLEGMDDLFADIPPVVSNPVPPPGASTSDPPVLTLEGMDDLFADAPAMPPGPEASPPAAETSTSQVDTPQASDSRLSASSSSTVPLSPPASAAISEFKLEQRDNVFVEVPLNPPSAEAVVAPSLPFALEYRDGVFVEVPQSESQFSEKKTELT